MEGGQNEKNNYKEITREKTRLVEGRESAQVDGFLTPAVGPSRAAAPLTSATAAVALDEFD